MKRLLSIFLAVMFISGVLMAGKAQAIPTLQQDYWHKSVAGQGFSMLIADQTDDQGNPVEFPYLWGIATMSSLATHVFPGPNQDPVAGPWFEPNIWSAGNTSGFVTVRFGNLKGTQTTGDTSYFGVSDIDSPSYLEFWWSETPQYQTALDAGPNVGSSGEYGTFAENLVTAPGATLLIAAEFMPGALWVEESVETLGNPQAFKDDLFRANLFPAGSRAETLGYLDIVGGIWAPLLQTGLHLNEYSSLLSEIGRDRGFDMRLEASNRGGVYETPTGNWNFILETGSATFYAIPEPGTFLLLGVGLLGLAGFARMRRRNKA